MDKLHRFKESLRYSHGQSGDPLWQVVYRRAFPTFASMHDIRSDGWAQRGGIDRIVMLRSGKTLKIDEKARRKDYSDILLELWSDEARKVKGWIAKDLACDYIAYAIIPSRKCYLLPFHGLRLAYFTNRRAWAENAKSRVAGFREIRAANPGYTTMSISVPIPVLLNSIRDAAVVSWGAAQC